MTTEEMKEELEKIEEAADEQFHQAIKDACEKFNRRLVPVIQAFEAGQAPAVSLKIHRL
jgi:molecular chaperone GrpE (heat shock protein)